MYPYNYLPVTYFDLASVMTRSEQTARLVTDIAKAISGEYSAIQCYTKLAEHAPSAEQRNRIIEIRRDEEQHFQVFSKIYTNLTGRQPSPQLTEQCPDEYKAGLEAALIDEQETVDFYLEIADRAEDPFIKEQFRRAAADEQNHAVWFMYLMLKQ